jgi:hypothetical protein
LLTERPAFERKPLGDLRGRWPFVVDYAFAAFPSAAFKALSIFSMVRTLAVRRSPDSTR